MAANAPKFALSPADADWGRWVTASIQEMVDERGRANLEAGAMNKGVAATLSALSEQILSLRAVIDGLPRQVVSDMRATGFALSGSYVSRVIDTITVPPGKTFVNVLCIGAGAAVDTGTGGLTTAYGRVVINGSTGGESPAAKDAGASQVNNVITAMFATSFAVTPDSNFSVALQMYGLNGSAFAARPANFAQIATIATFT